MCAGIRCFTFIMRTIAIEDETNVFRIKKNPIITINKTWILSNLNDFFLVSIFACRMSKWKKKNTHTMYNIRWMTTTTASTTWYSLWNKIEEMKTEAFIRCYFVLFFVFVIRCMVINFQEATNAPSVEIYTLHTHT